MFKGMVPPGLFRPLVQVAPHPGQTVCCQVSRNKMRLKKRGSFYIIYIYIYIYEVRTRVLCMKSENTRL